MNDAEEKIYNALQVIAKTPKTRAYLMLHDPQAMRQIDEAISCYPKDVDEVVAEQAKREIFKENLLKELRSQSFQLIRNSGSIYAKMMIEQAYKSLDEEIPESVKSLIEAVKRIYK